MISEERLEDIIQNKGTVWCIDKYNNPHKLRVIPITLKREFIKLWGEENLFETEDEAKEYLEYGNITRTEKFPYVSWEEFCDIGQVEIKIGTKLYKIFKYKETDKMSIVVFEEYFDGYISKEPLTRENYHKALDFVIRLWKGEKV